MTSVSPFMNGDIPFGPYAFFDGLVMRPGMPIFQHESVVCFRRPISISNACDSTVLDTGATLYCIFTVLFAWTSFPVPFEMSSMITPSLRVRLPGS